MSNIYDFVVIGAGISASTFVASLNTRFPDASILLIEQGRRVGGRSTTRKSRKNIILEFDHGLPSISLSHNISEDLSNLISPLLKSKKLIDITNDILFINEFGKIYNEFTDYKIYRGFPFMINFCEEIIAQSVSSKSINFLFNTVTKSIKRLNFTWELKTNHNETIKCKNLILSSSLIAHPRCLQVLNINSLPLRDAFIEGEDEIVDTILMEVKKQEYLKRKNYIMHVSNSQIVQNFNLKYLQICFEKVISQKFFFERIIFQSQIDGSMIIVLHCCTKNKHFDLDFEKIIQILISIFVSKKKFIDLFLQAKLINQMHWRASQPINNLLPIDLQWSSQSNIGFCGDWFDLGGYIGVEAAMNSSIRLAKLCSY